MIRLLAATRLLTLTDTGGVGKTRLALVLARAAAGDYPDGICLVELASLAAPTLVARAVAGVVGVTGLAVATSRSALRVCWTIGRRDGIERWLALARQALTEAEQAAAWAGGVMLAPNDAVVEALADDGR